MSRVSNWKTAQMHPNRLRWWVLIQCTEGVHGRIWNRAPNLNARLFTTKWKSRMVPANHTEQGGIHVPLGWIKFRVLELCCQDCNSHIKCDNNSKSQVQNTKIHVEQIDTWHLTSLHSWMFCICHHPKKEKMKAWSEELRNDLNWLWTGI